MSDQEAYHNLVGALENAQKVALVETRKQRDTAIRERDELRAILAPLLADPMVVGELCFCAFCRLDMMVRLDLARHAPDCPVLRRDALLGRAGGAA